MTPSKTKLTRKQEKFVEAFVETGVGAQAAKEAYDIAPTAHSLAAVIASENLTKPKIQEAIADKLTKRELQVDSAHESLLTAVRLDYFVFPKSMQDEEIKGHVESCGLTCINIRPSDRGKLAFFSLPDGASRSRGVELYHKLAGTFAPEKKLTINVAVGPSDKIKELAKKLNA